MGADPKLRELEPTVDRPPPRQSGPHWSIADLGLPLPLVAILIAQTVAASLYVDHRLSKIDPVIDQLREIKVELYRSQDASRDLALRDDRIAELTRRVAILEGYIDGRGRGR